jgi:hypothetical protein
MNNDTNLTNSLCKECKYRFRRVFIPLKPEEYVDEEGKSVLPNDSDEHIIITNHCLISDMDIDGEITIECSHYKRREPGEDFCLAEISQILGKK